MNWKIADFELTAALAEQLPFDDLPEVAFSGRSNVGKSSLINRLLERKGLARTSATPGKTASINFYRLDGMRMVDLPGYGYAKVSDAERKRWNALIQGYFDADRDLRLVLQLVDMRHPPSKEDRQMIHYFVEAGIPFIVVMTKADKLNKTERAAREAAMKEAFADLEGILTVPFSAVTGEGAAELREILESVTEE
ncbi:MAG: YihA family ribosome biogenesis GTP-binding protein [Ruminococcaceae bacterium]|nr:YihA family ribosome biogenesis GTP-binding protein [Oscillospiraceae bacterium]